MQLNLATVMLYHLLLLPAYAAAHNTAAILEPNEINMTEVILGMPQCKVFAHTLLANAKVLKTYQNYVDGGITMFCPLDQQFEAFLPEFRDLTVISQKCFLEFFAVPYYQSLSMLKSNNGFLKTLDDFKFTVQNDGQDVTLKTKITTAKITGTLFDEPPLAIHTIDKVLMPGELFDGVLVPDRDQASVDISEALAPASAQAPAGISGVLVPASAQAPVGIGTNGLKERETTIPCESSTDQMPVEDNSVVKVDIGICGIIVSSLFWGMLL